MKIEKVINQLESILAHVCSMAASPDADDIWKEDIDALEFALTALRSMPEAGELLSLEQLREMNGKPVWIKCINPQKYNEPPVGWHILEKSIVGTLGIWDGESCLCERDYEKDWLAYSYPPAHIDRSKWEACELCSLPDGKSASRLILAETCNGEAKYCPSCGRPLTEEAWAELERRLRG